MGPLFISTCRNGQFELTREAREQSARARHLISTFARRLSDTPMFAVESKSGLGTPTDVARKLLTMHYAASPFRH